MKSVNLACRDCTAWATEAENARNERDDANAEVEKLERQIDQLRAKLSNALDADRCSFRAAAQLDELCTSFRHERDDARRERDELRAQLDTVTLYAQRTTAQLRDEERENGSLRRRLREGGR